MKTISEVIQRRLGVKPTLFTAEHDRLGTLSLSNLYTGVGGTCKRVDLVIRKEPTELQIEIAIGEQMHDVFEQKAAASFVIPAQHLLTILEIIKKNL